MSNDFKEGPACPYKNTVPWYENFCFQKEADLATILFFSTNSENFVSE